MAYTSPPPGPQAMSCSPSEPDHQKEEALALCGAIQAIHRRGWCDGTGGNFSIVLSRTPLQLLMAPSGVDKGTVEPEDLIVVDADGMVIRGHGRASAETALHLSILASTGACAVLHTHSQAATLLSRLPLFSAQPSPGSPVGRVEALTADRQGTHRQSEEGLIGHLQFSGLEMLKGLEGITSHAEHIRLPILANSQNMRRLCEAAQTILDEAPYGLLIAGHGLYAWGESLIQAKRHLEVMEFLLEQHWRELQLHSLLTRSTTQG